MANEVLSGSTATPNPLAGDRKKKQIRNLNATWLIKKGASMTTH